MRCPVCRGALSRRTAGCAARAAERISRSRTGSRACSTTGCRGSPRSGARSTAGSAMAKAQGWYEPDDEIDAKLPYLCRDCGWDDKTWRANEHSFSLLLERYVRPGMRVLEVGAAKGWAAQHLVPLGVEYVAHRHPRRPEDRARPRRLLRGARRAVRARAGRRRAPARSRTARSTSSTASRRCTTRSTSARMVARAGAGDAARRVVCALNEGTRARRGSSGEVEDQAEEKELGINEHVHTLYAYLWAFVRARARGRARRARRGRRRPRAAADRREAAAAAGRRALGGDLVRADLLRLLGREPLRAEAPCEPRRST